jgi:hypothetical protein
VDLFIYDQKKHYRRFKLVTFNKNMLVTSASSAIVLHFGQTLLSVTYPVFKKSRISQHEHRDLYKKVRPHHPDSKGKCAVFPWNCISYRDALLAFKCMNNCAPIYLSSQLITCRGEMSSRETRNVRYLDVPLYKTATGQITFQYRTVTYTYVRSSPNRFKAVELGFQWGNERHMEGNLKQAVTRKRTY